MSLTAIGKGANAPFPIFPQFVIFPLQIEKTNYISIIITIKK
jgi:hypothetical protein